MKKILEKQIEKKVCDYAKAKGFLHNKFVSPSCRGVPDRIFAKNGKIFFIEFKALNKKPTELQKHKINMFRSHGLKVYIVDNIAYGKQVIDDNDI